MADKRRTVITTDGEVDDMNSFIRYLLYSNEIDTAGIILTSSVYHYAGNGKDIEPYRWTGETWILELIDRYAQIYPNLVKHADGFPEPEYLKSIYKVGNISAPGEMNIITEGSQFLEKLILDDDPRTLYIQTWGGTNTTARALKSIQERYEHTPEWSNIRQKIESKLVIYIILDQDVTYSEYIAKNWNISVVNDKFNFWYFAYMWKMVAPELTSRLGATWNLEKIRDAHGPLLEKYALIGDGNLLEGELFEEQRGTDEYLEKNPQYKRYEFISEGDSPSYFYLLNNGLRNAEQPEYGGWGGRFKRANSSLYLNEAVDYNPYTKRFEAEYSLTRWIDDIQADFAGRASWCLAENFEEVAHYPIIEKTELDLSVSAGEEVQLEIPAYDRNGLGLTYSSWCYFEASSYWKDKIKSYDLEYLSTEGLPLSIHSNEMEVDFTLDIMTHSSTVIVNIPKDAKQGDTFHIITEISNIADIPFKVYVRHILTIS